MRYPSVDDRLRVTATFSPPGCSRLVQWMPDAAKCATMRGVIADHGSGESTEIIYGEPRVPIVTRAVVDLRGTVKE
jgi:hypothetical protein